MVTYLLHGHTPRCEQTPLRSSVTIITITNTSMGVRWGWYLTQLYCTTKNKVNQKVFKQMFAGYGTAVYGWVRYLISVLLIFTLRTICSMLNRTATHHYIVFVSSGELHKRTIVERSYELNYVRNSRILGIVNGSSRTQSYRSQREELLWKEKDRHLFLPVIDAWCISVAHS